MEKSKEFKDSEKFVKQIVKLEPIDFIGIAKMLNVDTIKYTAAAENLSEPSEKDLLEREKEHIKNTEPRPFEEVFSEMLQHFAALSARGRKNLLNLMDRVIKESRGKKKYVNQYTKHDIEKRESTSNL